MVRKQAENPSTVILEFVLSLLRVPPLLGERCNKAGQLRIVLLSHALEPCHGRPVGPFQCHHALPEAHHLSSQTSHAQDKLGLQLVKFRKSVWSVRENGANGTDSTRHAREQQVWGHARAYLTWRRSYKQEAIGNYFLEATRCLAFLQCRR